MIDRYSRETFENQLPKNTRTQEPLWTCDGLVSGEYVYTLNFGSRCGDVIKIRSSIRSNDLAAPSGEDSIRIWIEMPSGSPVFGKLQKYVTRTPGWSKRLWGQLKAIRELYNEIGPERLCTGCGERLTIRKVRKNTNNKGRMFVTHDTCSYFEWIT